jgi:hypothetical protein
MRITNSIGYFLFAVALCVMMISGCGLLYPKPTHDPLAGWQIAYKEEPNQAITKDYQDYIQKEKLIPGKVDGFIIEGFFKDGTGQHAISMEASIGGNEWRHILIYDKNDKRIKTIKYVSGGYAS